MNKKIILSNWSKFLIVSGIFTIFLLNISFVRSCYVKRGTTDTNCEGGTIECGSYCDNSPECAFMSEIFTGCAWIIGDWHTERTIYCYNPLYASCGEIASPSWFSNAYGDTGKIYKSTYKPPASYEGKTCDIRWNWDCSGSLTGLRYDPDQESQVNPGYYGGCVSCSGNKETYVDFCGGEYYDIDPAQCEQACDPSVPDECDDKVPGTDSWCSDGFLKWCSSACDVVGECQDFCGAVSACDELTPWETDLNSCCAEDCYHGGGIGYIRYDGSYDRLCDDDPPDPYLVWRKANLNRGKIYSVGLSDFKFHALSNYYSWIECDGDGIQERTGDGITVSRFCHKGAPASVCGGYSGDSLILTAHDYICGVEDDYKDSWYECCGDTTCTSSGDGKRRFKGETESGGGRAFICCEDERWYEYDPSETGCCDDLPCSNNYACNKDTHTCYTSCSLNSHCTSGFCCEAEINFDITGGGTDDCVGNGAYGQYLCYHTSPSRWIECNEENLNEKVEANNVTYTCVKQNGSYEWVTSYTTEQVTKQTQTLKETQKINLFELIINFLRNLFNFLKSG